MIKGGYYIKARCIQDSEIAHTAPHIREIWDWVLKEANHKDTKVCKRGQCVRSYKDIQEGLLWYIGWRKMTYSKDQCEIAMKWLRKRAMITTKKTTRGLIITIVNYDKYQLPANYDNHTQDATITTREPQNLHTINKNDKNVKNDKNDIVSTADEIKQVFELFYNSINPTISFGNKTQRKSAEDLIKKFGLEETIAMTQYAISIQGLKYSPVITTPYQLKEKLGQLAIYKKQKETPKIIKAD